MSHDLHVLRDRMKRDPRAYRCKLVSQRESVKV